jgi:hypothetical protein
MEVAVDVVVVAATATAALLSIVVSSRCRQINTNSIGPP